MQYLAAEETEVWQKGMRIDSAIIATIYHLEKSDYWSLMFVGCPETQLHINANGVLHLQDK